MVWLYFCLSDSASTRLGNQSLTHRTYLCCWWSSWWSPTREPLASVPPVGEACVVLYVLFVVTWQITKPQPLARASLNCTDPTSRLDGCYFRVVSKQRCDWVVGISAWTCGRALSPLRLSARSLCFSQTHKIKDLIISSDVCTCVSWRCLIRLSVQSVW